MSAKKVRWYGILIAFAVLPFWAQVAANPTDDEATAPLEIVTPFAPSIVEGTDRLLHLVYEVHLTNFATVPETLTRFTVFSDDANHTLLGDFAGSELDAMIVHPGLEHGAVPKGRLAGNARGIIFVWLSLKQRQELPRGLLEEFDFDTIDSDTGKAETQKILVPLALSKLTPRVLASPLRGGGWIAGNGPSNTSVHRRGSFPYYGAVTNAERYACDFIRLRSNGMAFEGDPGKNENWVGFGTEVMAAADGTVVGIQDGVPENIPLAKETAVEITFNTSGGNYVVEDIGGGLFAAYAHLEPHSLRVKVGDRVRTGQVLGLLGNTGNSTCPHLHFQVATGKRFAEGEGVPVVFKDFSWVEHADLAQAVGLHGPAPTGLPSKGIEQHNTMPLKDDVLTFPSTR